MPRRYYERTVDILARVLKLKHQLGEGEYDHQDYDTRVIIALNRILDMIMESIHNEYEVGLEIV